MSHRRIAVATCIAVVLALGIVFAQAKPPFIEPVTIDVPGFSPYVVSLQTAGAWPLTINMEANRPMGVATYQVPWRYPMDAQQAFIVWADPDRCFSMSLWTEPGGVAPCPNYQDETYLEFTPTVNLPNLEKGQIDKVSPVRLGPAPRLMRRLDNATFSREAVPPFNVGADNAIPCGSAGALGCDNYGYGASPNLPGLVILSNRGVGLKWDESSDAAEAFTLVGAARNLAGFVNSVSWTLNNCAGPRGCGSGEVSVTAHMNVPPHLFGPVVRLDLGHTTGGVTSGRAYQIDGGAWVDDNSFRLLTVLRQMVTTVRVFVVKGPAPDVLLDENLDGVVDIHDAIAAGLTVLSGEQTIRFRIYHQTTTPGQSNLAILYDHNGDGMDGDEAPAGGGGISPIPR